MRSDLLYESGKSLCGQVVAKPTMSRSGPLRDRLADFERHARRFIVGIANSKRLVQFEIVDVRYSGAGQEFPATDVI